MNILCFKAICSFVTGFILCSFSGSAQYLEYGRKIVDTLASPYFWGRGYTNDGLEKAAAYLAGELGHAGVLPLNGDSYFQPFSYSVNTFPGDMRVRINDRKMMPGIDFLIGEESKGIKYDEILLHEMDTADLFYNEERKVVVELVEKLVWRPAPVQEAYTRVQILKSSERKPELISLDVDAEWIEDFKTANVCGWVRGTQNPDSFLVITAHYDHLGGMGKMTYFPGANDNASGVALMMNLAQYYAKNPLPYSVAFLAFSGEEIGLLGSEYFVQHPLIPLERIRFLVNTDLAGNGDEGITVVNATEFPVEFEYLQNTNREKELLAGVHSRGKAKNSDHYYFTERGVPAFFIYTQGGIAAYHDIYDKAETLPMHEHEDLFTLIKDFFEYLSAGE